MTSMAMEVLNNAKLSFLYISAVFKIQLLPALASSTDSRKKANNFGPTPHYQVLFSVTWNT